MSIDLRQQAETKLIDLSKKATISLSKNGLGGQRARVALCLDISASMNGLYRSGIVQEVTEKLLALAMNFDDNGAADVFLFGARHHEIGEIEQSNFYQFVDREITSRFPLENSTNYAGVIRKIADHYFPGALTTVVEKKGFLGMGTKKALAVDVSKYREAEPVYVLFITDGDNYDKAEATEILTEVAKLGIFWQFVGVGESYFHYLEQLDNLAGRFVDNANFFKVSSLAQLSDDQLYDRLLHEFPDWLREAKAKRLIKG
ncbi:TerF-like vWA domain-containing protein [Tumebacillus sp. BK434]|uniref:VWA domain-containing protein n=1 Tax=Tumebacillus sp. BK434 TaxID=2512169 RepID=UPI001044B2A8|nr:VWA domain-containing protein [Tumebacillus sp. BK434]TCP57919.1 TerF-like vWA domain-containing protein [Tumebacillus sp. BK434]